jgi:hypothetical protein
MASQMPKKTTRSAAARGRTQTPKISSGEVEERILLMSRQIYSQQLFPKWQPAPEIVAGVNSENRASVSCCFRSLNLVCTLTPSCHESGGANGPQ